MSNRYLPGRAAGPVALSLAPWLLLAAGCPSDTTTTTDSGASDPSTSSSSSSSTEPGPTSTSVTPTTTGSTTDEPTSSTTEVAPAVCGDGEVAGVELCDDGNDEPDDGCNSKCEKTGAVEWTYTYNGAAGEYDAANAIAVDPTGKIIIVGSEAASVADIDPLIIALAPDGTELWRKTYPGEAGLDDGFSDVVLDDAGNIYAGGYEGTAADTYSALVRKFDGDGNPDWTYLDPPAMIDFSDVNALVLHDGALYSAGGEDLLDMGSQLVIRRHDLTTGETAWKTVSQADAFRVQAAGLTVANGQLVVAGGVYDEDDVSQPLIALLDTEGTIVSLDIEDHLGGAWFDVATVGATGDLVLAGRRRPRGVTFYDIGVRRVGPDLSEQWTDIIDHDFLYDTANGVAVGPDESLFVSGFYVKGGEFDNMWGGRYAGDGTRQWTHTYNNDEIDLYDEAVDVAFGPDFMLLAGRSNVLGEDANVWVRRFKAD